MRYSVALSEHPDIGLATGEVIGQILNRIGSNPDLVFLFLTGPHLSSIEKCAETVISLLNPKLFIGTSAPSILAHRQEIEGKPAIALWAGQIDNCHGLHLTNDVPLPSDLADESSVILIADPHTFNPSPLLASIPDGVNLVGGLTSTDPLHKSSQLILNKDIYESGAVAVLLPPGIGAHPIVSQGCRPIDQPFTVTSSSNNVIYELAGRPAWDRLKELVQNSDKSTRELITRGLHIGLVIDEHLEKFEMGDFLIRTIIDVDRSNGTLTVGSEVPLGSTIQFQVRDPETASSELHNLNQSLEAESVLLFTCNGRGHRFFGHPNHDAECFANQLATTQVVGMFCGGELGPIGGRHFLHGFTASALLLGVKKIQ